jgi:hypothetical protein
VTRFPVVKTMKRIKFLFYAALAVVVIAEILILRLPSLVPGLIDLLPPTLPVPPKGFDVRREGIDRGTVESVEYESKSAGCKRKMQVYTPPGFARDKTYLR